MARLDFDKLSRIQKRNQTYKHNLANWYFKYNAIKRKDRRKFLESKKILCPDCRIQMITPILETSCVNCRKNHVK